MIEILIVAAVIGALLAVVLPNIASIRRRSQDEKLAANIGIIEQSLYQYRERCRSYPKDNPAGKLDINASNGLPGVNGGVCPGGVTLGSLLPPGFIFDPNIVSYYALVRSGSAGAVSSNRCTSFHLGIKMSDAMAVPISRAQKRGQSWADSKAAFGWQRCGGGVLVNNGDFGADYYDVVAPAAY